MQIGMRWVVRLILLCGIRATICAQTSPAFDEQTAAHLVAAQQAEKAQDFENASRQYQEILRQHPKLAVIHQSLAVTYHLQNHFSEAIPEFQRALQLDSAMWGSYLFLGMDYYKTNQFSAAIAPLEKSIWLNAGMAEPEARFWLAVTYSALNKPDEALRELRRDLVLRPGNADVLYYLAKTYDQAAAVTFERLGRIAPNSAAVSLLQAERFLDENRKDLATMQYRQAIALRPDFGDWLPALDANHASVPSLPGLLMSATDAQASLELARLTANTALLQTLAIQKPEDPEAEKAIGAAKDDLARLSVGPHSRQVVTQDLLKGFDLVQRGRFHEAEQPLRQAAQKDTSRSLQLLLMRAYVEAGDGEQMESELRDLLAAESHNADVILLLGREYKHEAESALQRLIQVDPDCYGVHELLGKQHEEKTEYDAAITEYLAALAKRPDLAGVHYAIGNVYRKMRRYDDAERWLMEELALNPYHGLAHYRLGSIYTEQRRSDLAIPHLLQALKSHPRLLDAQLDLGRAYTEAGKYEAAVTTLRQVSHEDPENDRVHYLLSLAYSKEGRRSDAQTEMVEYQRMTRSRLQKTQHDVNDLASSLDR